jgi:hypothetical protein
MKVKEPVALAPVLSETRAAKADEPELGVPEI